MKITKRQLRRIIKEEKAKVLAEQKIRRTVRRRLLEQSRVERDASAGTARVVADPDSAFVDGPDGTIDTEEELMDMITDQEVVIEGGQEIRILGDGRKRAAVVYDIADVLQDMLAAAGGDGNAVVAKLESVAKRVSTDGRTDRSLNITSGSGAPDYSEHGVH